MTLEPEPEPQPDIDINAVVTAWERADAEAEIQADHWTEVTFDGPELRSGTPECEAEYAEYQAWVAQPDPEPEADREAEPVPYTLTPRAETVLASWDRFHALDRGERLAFGEAEPEPEAEL